jgi:TatD DNase family protein
MNELPKNCGVELFPMAGIHPCDVHQAALITEEELINWAKDAKAVGIGETGLDYYWSKDYIDLQKESLKIHFEVAKELDLPVVLHNRDSTDDFLEMVEMAQDGRLRGVWHCFNGSVEEGRRAIDAGLHLGLGGVITFKKGGMDEVITHLPSNRFILETDSPFLAPTPNRGKRNEPAYTALVLARLSELLNQSQQELAIVTTHNAEQLFNRTLDYVR